MTDDSPFPAPLVAGVARSVSGRAWHWRRPGGDALDVPLTDQLLMGRGAAADDLARHRDPRLRDWLPDPSAFADMERGAERLADAILSREAIAIFGDYDVDGATSAALLARLLGHFDIVPRLYIPDRVAEGYGPSIAALSQLKDEGASLVLMVDCGAMGHEALGWAADAGLDVVVCDHHQCATELPRAHALINPNRLDESGIGAAHGHLAAVGVAFLLAVACVRVLRARGAFETRPEPALLDLLDLVALGTVADVAKLHGLNRAFVRQGLKVMAKGRNPGLSALMQVAGIQRAPQARDLGFALGPRINAGGRVGQADLGVRLLTQDDPDTLAAIAADLNRLNEERRAIEMLVSEAAAEQLGQPDPDAPLVLVAATGWHPGVIGIVASRLKERFGVPAIVVALDEDGSGKGSGRSITGVDLGAAVLAAREAGVLAGGGGHAMAAGLTLAPGQLDGLRAFLTERLAAPVAAARAGQVLKVDALVAPGGIGGPLADALEGAGPYGAGWPGPRVVAGPVRLLGVGVVGSGHVRARAVGDDGRGFKLIAFRAADSALGQAVLASPPGARWWLAGTVRRDEWTGGEAAELHLEDAARADRD